MDVGLAGVECDADDLAPEGEAVAIGVREGVEECLASAGNVVEGGEGEIAGFVGGGMLALTSALLLTLPLGKQTGRPGLGCGPGPGAAGIACGGSF